MLSRALTQGRRNNLSRFGGNITASEQRRFNNSFMKTVMEQMKKDMDKNEELKKAYEELQKNKKDRTGPTVTDTVKERIDFINKKSNAFAENFSQKTEDIKFKWSKIRDDNQKVIDETPAFKAVQDTFGGLKQSMSGGLKMLFRGAQTAATKLSPEEEEAKKKNEEWKRELKYQREKDASRSKESAAENVDTEKKSDEGNSSTSKEEYEFYQGTDADAGGLVVRHETTWERFGSKVKDMPFVNKFYSNVAAPAFFGQTELNKALTRQKEIDPKFSFPEFCATIQHVVCRRVVEAYLLEDTTFMTRHCANSALDSFKASIRERRTLKVQFDDTILKWEDANMKTGVLSDDPDADSRPTFLWTVSCQQINCLRNDKGDIVEGDEDDIRAVTYALAVRSHPNPAEVDGLEFPYEVTEFVMIDSRPCII